MMVIDTPVSIGARVITSYTVICINQQPGWLAVTSLASFMKTELDEGE